MSARGRSSGPASQPREPEAPRRGRSAQRRRTRQAIVNAANELLDEGRRTSLDEVALRADVSRATVYRYFSNADDLMTDAVLDRSLVPVKKLFSDESGDLLDRALAVEEALHTTLFADEIAVHVASKLMAEAWLAGDPEDHGGRPGRRLPLIDAALEPFAGRLGPGLTLRLRSALALALGTEAVIALRDVCRLSPEEARGTAQWTIASVVSTALAQAASEGAAAEPR